MTPGAKAALAVWGSALLWDAFCEPGQTVSEAIGRGLENPRTEPVVTVMILATAVHLLRAVDERYDIYSVAFKGLGRLLKRSV